MKATDQCLEDESIGSMITDEPFIYTDMLGNYPCRFTKEEDPYSRIPVTVEEKNREMIEEELCREAALDDDQVRGLKLKSHAQRYGGVTDMNEDMLKWKSTHPDDWGPKEVISWLTYALSDDTGDVHFENFNTVTGPQLRIMTLQELEEKDPKYGGTIFNEYQKLLQHSEFNPPPLGFLNSLLGDLDEDSKLVIDTQLHDPYNIKAEPTADYIQRTYSASSQIMSCSNSIYSSWSSNTSSSTNYQQQPQQQLQQQPQQQLQQHEQALFNFITSSSPSSSSTSSFNSNSSTLERHGLPFPPRLAKRGRPRKHPINADGSYNPSGAKKPGHTTRERLWKFLIELLSNPAYCPSHITWEKKEEGIFRFVKSEQVAQMWGMKKNNTKMTYEKLSRAMRYCRTSNFFADVPKDGAFPKKLCFKFGPKAKGWQDT